MDDTLAAYVAGAFDWSGGLKIVIEQTDSSLVGYRIKFQVDMTTTRPLSMGMLDEFQSELGLQGSMWVNERETRDLYAFRLTRQDDVEKFLEGVFPHLAGRHDAVRLLLDYIFPMLEDGKGSSKEGWLELMEVVDEFREHTGGHSSGRVKYDAEYFRDEWNMQ